MPDYPTERTKKSRGQTADSAEVHRKQNQSHQPRQLLSCTKCRERKVKCDRTKPCSACCARGQPRDCHFIAEGGDYAPIQQSYELRKLRAENLRLKERLRAGNFATDDDDSDPVASPDSQLGERMGTTQRRRTTKQKRFQGSEWQDSIYFGSPGLASVITDFAAVNINPVSASLTHLMPRGSDMYTPRNPPPYPFPTIFPASLDACIPELLACLPPKDEILGCLRAFESRVNVCSFPHVPFEITQSEIERFLSNAEADAQRCPDMLALLFAALALGGQHFVWDRSGGQWEPRAMHEQLQNGDVFIAAAMQALRLASFMHRPSLMGIQALIMIGPYLTNSGRFLDAWTLFGTTIRLAHSIGLHRHPKYLDPAPPTQRECSVRQTLWWWMLHMDEQYSMTLGRPLGISGIGDCPPPHELTTDTHMLRFGDFVNHFTLLARKILSSDRLTNAKIDEYTDALRNLLETMPEMLQFDKSWLNKERELPEWPLSAMAAVYHCKTHTYMLLLNRQRVKKSSSKSAEAGTKTPPFSRAGERIVLSSPSPATSTTTSLRGRALVLSSAEQVVDAFLFFYMRVPAALISWTMGQQAFNACMILLLDAIELRQITPGAYIAEKAYVVFQGLQNVHKLATLAMERISWGLKELRDVTQAQTQPPPTRQDRDGDAKMQGTGSEATQALRAEYENTVMNATGMLLLEDPGLQGFVPEAFAPISWNLSEFEAGIPQLKVERNPPQDQLVHQAQRQTSRGSDEDIHDVRSAGALQGQRRSTAMRSAHTSYATSSLDDPQPPSITAPDSRTRLAKPMQQHHHVHATATNPNFHYGPPPHLRHAQLRDVSRDNHEFRPASSVSDKTPLHHPVTFPDQHPNLLAQLRHNSCPSISVAPDPGSVLSNFSYSSSSSPEAEDSKNMKLDPPGSYIAAGQATYASLLDSVLAPTSAENSQNFHPSWADRLSGQVEVSTASSLGYLPTAPIGQALTTMFQPVDQRPQQIYPLVPQASGDAAYAVNPVTENVTLDEWRRWLGASRAG